MLLGCYLVKNFGARFLCSRSWCRLCYWLPSIWRRFHGPRMVWRLVWGWFCFRTLSNEETGQLVGLSVMDLSTSGSSIHIFGYQWVAYMWRNALVFFFSHISDLIWSLSHTLAVIVELYSILYCDLHISEFAWFHGSITRRLKYIYRSIHCIDLGSNWCQPWAVRLTLLDNLCDISISFFSTWYKFSRNCLVWSFWWNATVHPITMDCTGNAIGKYSIYVA